MQRIKNIAITRRLLPLLSYATHCFCGSGRTDAVGHLLNGDYFWLKTETRANKQNYKDMATLETLNFDNLVLRTLPIDDEKANYTRQVSGACFSLVKPTPVDKPKVVSVSLPAMQLLDLHEDQVKRPDFASYFSGNLLPEGSETAAHCYCGHQFGHFSGQLGDGAAMYLGEIVNKNGERWEIQLKGAGKTPYSRSADGRKVLRSTIREFLCSEAMHHLGIPTTRAGCCVTSESKVIRDVFYNGNAIQERCSIVLRIAQSFIRFGSFEIFKSTDMETGRKGPSTGRHDILELMLQYVIKTFYANIWEAHKEDKTQAYLAFYKEILTRTASLVAGWQCVGFCHGVLNTDNMSIVGVTIDYGPYGFMDSFDPSFICNASDDGGRYSYENQPEICKWNLLKLAEALQPIVPMEKMKEILETYDDVYQSFYLQRMRQKLGLRTEKTGDQELIESFLSTLAQTGGDFTNCFRCLSLLHLPGSSTFTDSEKEVKTRLLSQCCTVEELKKSAQPRMDPRQLSTFMMLMQMNPDLLAQLGSDQKAISQELKRIEKSQQLKDLTQEEKQAKDEELWEAWLNKYISRLKEEETGSEKVDVVNAERIRLMNSVNPRIVLRNYIAQMAIEKAEGGDFSEVQRVLSLLQQPFSDHTEMTGLQGGVAAMTFNKESSTAEESKSKASTSTSDQPSHVTVNYEGKPPSWAADLRVT